MVSKYFNYEPRFTEAFSPVNLRRREYGTHVINLDNNQSKGMNWVSLFIDTNIAVYFDSFGIEYILQEVLNKIKKSIVNNILRIQYDDSIVWILFYHFHRIYDSRKKLIRLYQFCSLGAIKKQQHNV